MSACACNLQHQRKRVVLTGGPGAGKTAVLELVRQSFCSHVRVLPEAAGIVFGGGFPREHSAGSLRAAQRAIFHIEVELEAAADDGNAAIVLCDRGTVDSAAYWPGPGELWTDVGSTLEEQLRRYDTVIHLRTPASDRGYHNLNPLRLETAAQAAETDRRIEQLWSSHPRRFLVEAESDFVHKARRALDIIRAELPACCRPAHASTT
jgi:predicted ATPase